MMHTRRLVAPALLATISLAAVGLGGCARKSAPQLLYNDRADMLRRVLEAGVEAGGGGGGPSLGEPKGFATLRGTFKINGPAPQRSPLNITKEQDICAPGGRAVLDERIVIGPGDGIKDVLIHVSSKLPQNDPNWEHESYLATKQGEVLFDQKDCIFLSHVAVMRSTQRLKILNSDPVGHNTNLDSKRGARSYNPLVPGGDSVFYEPGAASPTPFSVTCSIHPWMKANMMVCDHPYFAVTKEDGSFEIPYVPAGVELEFRVWQEAVGYLQDVTVNGAAERWSKGKFKRTLSPDEPLELDVVVDSSAFE